ncbi:uncharacterized protein BDR25DRAFT_381938 [Lindgomyces ingoldianus]|uniref:Uncharacterized protein n=1 Tax=Lindgomyces ingoldianus TaxID=673940 RepID=A0ACB6R9C5_9PLEO|nr:uncharacterized protein BDR25DRAFT_381938 [Lindgomyces ingoldianus]KAF2475122.1 hypothetical protein BDR25DRAFT_381938 [Lindgomyces ingoldianus]
MKPMPQEQTRRWELHKRKLTLREKFFPFPWKCFLIVSALPFALAPIVILSAAAEEASQGYLSGRACYPNGMWSESPGATWRIMDSTYFFTPNLSFGKMSFSAAKIIDISWDLLVGRGGQLLLAYVNYQVFNEWLVYHMEIHLTSYKMYSTVAFQTTSLSALGVLGKEFLAFGESSWRRFFRWLGIFCMLLSTLYVLSFPTLMAAMTGYINASGAYVEDYNNNLIEFNKFKWVAYIVEDAHRIGYSKPLVAASDDEDLQKAIYNYISTMSTLEEFNRDLKVGLPWPPRTFFFDRPSIWQLGNSSITLEAPSLNITWAKNTELDVSPKLKHWLYTDGDSQGDVFDAFYVHAHGSCRPNETYQWGFSYIFLFMVSIFNFVWSCIMVGMWLDTRRGSRMYKSGRRPGLLRSIMDISGAIREELGVEVDNMEEQELRKRLNASRGALWVPRKELKITKADLGDQGFKHRGRWKTLTQGSTF